MSKTKKPQSPALFIHRLEWFNPYTSPPDGRPRVRAEIATLDSRTPAALIALKTTPGDGWSNTVRYCPPPSEREMTPEAKASMRRKRLGTLMNKKYPLFAEQFVAEKITAMPNYYLDGTSEGDAERLRILAEEREYYERMSANVGRLFVYEAEGQP